MAQALLRKRIPYGELGIRWMSGFLKRNRSLASVYVSPKNRKRVVAGNIESYQDWFRLYQKTVTDYTITPDNQWNMNEQKYALEVLDRSHIITLKKS